MSLAQKSSDDEIIAQRTRDLAQSLFEDLWKQVPERYHNGSFKMTWHPKICLKEERWTKVLHGLDKFTKEHPEANIFLCGPVSTGKTTLAAAIFRRLASKEARLRTTGSGVACPYWLDSAVWADNAVTYKFGRGPKPKIYISDFSVSYRGALRRALFLDDIDKVSSTSTQQFEEMRNFLQVAYGSKSQMVITTNLTMPDFQQRFGDYMSRRVEDDGDSLIVDLFKE